MESGGLIGLLATFANYKLNQILPNKPRTIIFYNFIDFMQKYNNSTSFIIPQPQSSINKIGLLR